MRKLLLMIAVTGWLAVPVGADVRKPKVFGDHMLPQREKSVNTRVLERSGETQPAWKACRQCRSFMTFMKNILNYGQMSKGVKEKVAAGMMQATRDPPIEPGYLGAIGRNNRLETLRYFLERAPESAPQVLDELERLIELIVLPEYQGAPVPWTGDWSWTAMYVDEGGWGNPGIIKSAEKLGQEQGAPMLARCKLFVAKLDERK